ncbi:MAG: DUF4157 domain-containing protein [Myxococcales bacterium]|nr:DUF4157 domain-containing protein [Myxococcales bacterium]
MGRSRSAEGGVHEKAQPRVRDDARRPRDPREPIAEHADADALLGLQRSIGNAAVVRLLRAPAASRQGGPLDAGLTRAIHGARGRGQSLPGPLQRSMSTALGRDLGGVRVHTDAHADGLSRALSAQAFTVGSDVFFRRGAYQPSTAFSRRVLAHELTHVAQDSGSRRSGPLTVGHADDRCEREADATSDRLLRGEPVSVRQRGDGSIRRYTVIDHASNGTPNYTKFRTTSGVGFDQMFPWQKTVAHEIDPELQKRRFQLGYVTGATRFPRLRVADTGEMAIKDTDGDSEEKAFYATPGLIAGSNERLGDIGSAVELVLSRSNSIETPVPGTQENKRLYRVTPRLVGSLVNETTMSECNEIAGAVTAGLGQSGVVRFTSDDEEKRTKMDYDEPTESMSTQRIAAAVINRESPEEMTEKLADATPQQIRALRPRFRAQITAGRLPETAVALMAASWVPETARQEILLRLQSGETLTYTNVRFIIQRHYQTLSVRAYARASSGDRSLGSRGLGVNEYAMPEVGESFGIFNLKSFRDTTVRGQTGMFNYKALTDEELQELNDQLKPEELARQPKYAIELLFAVTRDAMFKRAWTWHFAAVIARSGHDVMTFENYNRATTEKHTWQELFETLEQEYQQAAADPTVTNAKAFATKVQAIVNQVGGDNLEIVRDFSNPTSRWYFQMYGPPTKTGQSFHASWEGGDFTAALTLTVGAEALPAFKNTKKLLVTQERDQTLLQIDDAAKADYRALVDEHLAAIDAAQTKLEVVKLQRATGALPRQLKQRFIDEANRLSQRDGLRTGGADLTMQSTWLEIGMVLNTRATMASRKLGTTSSFWHPHVHARLTTASTDLPTLRLKLLALQTLNP